MDEGFSGPSSPIGSEGELIGSEGATGHGSIDGQDHMDNLSDNMSDTGWDTDLEIEGIEYLHNINYMYT